jgi:hypothetical protein
MKYRFLRSLAKIPSQEQFVNERLAVLVREPPQIVPRTSGCGGASSLRRLGFAFSNIA